MAALGYSFGWGIQKVKAWKRPAVRFIVTVTCFAGIGYSIVPIMTFASTLPAVNLSVVALMAATGFLLFGAASFCYVLFAFMAKMVQADPNIRRDIQYLVQRAAAPLKTAAGAQTPATANTGSFTPYTEDRAYLQEQFDYLVQAKILRPEDDLDKILKEGEIDIEMLKDRGVTEH